MLDLPCCPRSFAICSSTPAFRRPDVLLAATTLQAIKLVPDEYAMIQSAIDAAANGEAIHVAPGAYHESINFLGKAISVRSTDGPEVTTIEADGGSTVSFIGGGGQPALLLGFTITGGTGTDAPKHHSDIAGGGVYARNSEATILHCRISGNNAQIGGGIYNFDSELDLVNCLVAENSADAGGGIFSSGTTSTVLVVNCTFGNNEAGVNGGTAIYNQEGEVTTTNSILWDNAQDEIKDTQGGTTNVQYCDVQGGWLGAGFGNIDADPLFGHPGLGDYRLTSHSPPIDTASNPAVPAGVTTDLDGNPRFLDDPDNTDCWQAPGTCGDPPIVDMGAYEYQVPPCPWDCTTPGDDEVAVNDFLTMLSQWGNAGSCDFDGGGVGVTDFLALLAHWGHCP
jgi:hypothetical protein